METRSMNDEAFDDLMAALKWGVELDLTDNQRAAIKPLCIQLCEPAIPSWRLKDEAVKKREALARANELETRVAELEGVLRNKRQEFAFRRGVDKCTSR